MSIDNRPQWEYDKKYANYGREYTASELNRLGDDGWELAACYTQFSYCGGTATGVTYIFKRHKPTPKGHE